MEKLWCKSATWKCHTNKVYGNLMQIWNTKLSWKSVILRYHENLVHDSIILLDLELFVILCKCVCPVTVKCDFTNSTQWDDPVLHLKLIYKPFILKCNQIAFKVILCEKWIKYR